jgi:hypothetical protein
MLVEEADYLSHLYRWTLMTGEVPRAQDWLKREDWPHPDHVIDVFGSWEKFLSHAELPSSPLLAKVREAEATRRDLAAREKAIEREAGRAEDLRRQVETGAPRREAAEAERDEAARAPGPRGRALGGGRGARRPGGGPAAERGRAAAAAEAAPSRAGAPDPRAAAAAGTGTRRWPTSSRRSARTARKLLRRVEELTEGAARGPPSLARLSACSPTGGARVGAAPRDCPRRPCWRR